MKGLTIYLGSRCNLNCSYCHREADESEGDVSEQLLNCVRGRSDIHIKFMGGEPTLYFEEIKKVVAAAPDAQYAIATNGVNLDDYLDFFARYNFLVCISYDGTDESLRGYDPFTKLLQYPRLAVSCTLYHGNTDFKTILNNFAKKEKIIGRRLSFFPHIAHATGPHNQQYSLTRQDADVTRGQYKDCLLEFINDYLSFGAVNFRYLGLFRELQARYLANYEFGETYCVNKKLKKCDSKGRLTTCLYLRHDTLTADDWQRQQAELIRSRFPECEQCDVYHMCGAACIKSTRHDIECYFYKPLYQWFKTIYQPHETVLNKLEGF